MSVQSGVVAKCGGGECCKENLPVSGHFEKHSIEHSNKLAADVITCSVPHTPGLSILSK